jgi:hypothetical protein
MKISVVMSVYNGAGTVGATIESILAQTERDFELIVVDDGSSDDTPTILSSYAARDPRIRISSQKNSGLTQALVAGCAAARGMYIARHDAGDISHPRRLEAAEELLDADARVVFVSCWTAMVGPEGEPLYESQGAGHARRPASILDLTSAPAVSDGPTHHGAVMFRRDAYARVGGYRPAFYYSQDWDLWYRLAAIGAFQMVEEVLYTARLEPASISSAMRGAQQEIAKLAVEAARVRARGDSDALILERVAKIRPPLPRTLCAEARGNYFIGETLRRNGDARGRSYLLRAVRSCPLLLRAWVRLFQSMAMSQLSRRKS